MHQHTNNQIEIQNVCHDALTFLNTILDENSALNFYAEILENESDAPYLSCHNSREFDVLLKNEVKKHGNFLLSWNFNKWYRSFDSNVDYYKRTHSNIVVFLSSKFQQEITYTFLGQGEYSKNAHKSNQLGLFSKEYNFLLSNVNNLHILNKEKSTTIEKKFNQLILSKYFENFSEKRKAHNFSYTVQLLDTIQSTLHRIEPNYLSHSKKKKKSNFGSAKGMINIHSDFNEPLDDFKDYM